MSRIYIDYDDVLSATATSLAVLAKREFGRSVDYANIREFNLQNVFHLSDAEMARFMALAHTPAALMAYDVIPGAAAGMNSLRAAGHVVEIVTGRPAAAHAASAAWLHAAGIDGFPLVHVDKYNRYDDYPHHPGDPATVPLAEFMARHYDFAVDDSVPILESLAAWKTTRVLVFDRPWNASFRLAPNMARVATWPALVAAIDG